MTKNFANDTTIIKNMGTVTLVAGSGWTRMVGDRILLRALGDAYVPTPVDRKRLRMKEDIKMAPRFPSPAPNTPPTLACRHQD